MIVRNMVLFASVVAGVDAVAGVAVVAADAISSVASAVTLKT